MAFKSLIIFALVASVGRVLSAPLDGRHLGARNPCHRTWCARSVADNEYSNLARRFAEFDDPNVSLSSGSPGTPTSVDPSATLDPSSIPSTYSSSTPSVYPSSIPPAVPSVSPSSLPGDDGVTPSSTSNGIPQATDPAAGEPVTVTVISTIFLTPSDPAGSLPPVQSPPPSNPSVSQPALVPTSVSFPPSGPFPTVIELTNTVPGNTDTVPGTTVSSNPAGQPTPSPTTPGGIIFLPPN